jgi:uroporphyrin-3 C-methyltransferase
MSEQQDNDRQVKEHRGSYGLPALIATILLGVILLVGGYFGFQYVAEKFDESDAQVEKVMMIAKQTQKRSSQLEDAVQNLQEELQKSNLTKTKYWSPIVIEHLIRMANLTLNTTGDTKLAVVFLETAREYTKAPELVAVDNSLSNDIASLQSISVVDQTDLILKIDAIAKKVEALPLVAREFVKEEKVPETKSSVADGSLWRRVLQSVIDALSDIVSIRRQTTDPLLLPEQENILRLNISAKLLEAEFAVMQKQNVLYQTSLDNVERLIDHYFAANNVAIADILSSLDKLKQVDLRPKLPSLTASISAVMDVISESKEKNVKKEPVTLVVQSQNEGVRP